MTDEEEFSITESIKKFRDGNSSPQELSKEFGDIVQPVFDEYCQENNLNTDYEK